MNRSYRSLLIAVLAGMVLLLAGLCWAQTSLQYQESAQQKKAAEQKKDEQQAEEYTEEEYNAYQATADEKDQAKKAALVLAFMDKYPKSKLLPHVTPLYDTILYEVNKAGDHKKLLEYAEKWIKLNPNNLQVQAYIFDAAVKLSDHQKAVDYGEKIFAQKPAAELASILYNSYDKLGNKAKKSEWHLKLLEYPEFNDNFHLRWILVEENANKGDLIKAALYAEQTIKSLALAKKPAGTSDADWTKTTKGVEKGCYDVIGRNQIAQKRYTQAIETFQKAIKVERYDGAYYYIAQSYWNMNQVDEAIDYFAMAELLKGPMEAQAKKHCSDLYKSQHNGLDTGIDKVYRRAKATLGLPN
jgi:tetratricopeptide (TPR) repeat protein